MKFLSLMALGLFTINVQALPILTESMNGSGSLATLYQDHENPHKVYFMPNRGGLQKDSSGTPEFGLSYWGLKEPEKAGGFMAGIFNLWTGEELQNAIDAQIRNGKQVAVLPVQSSYIHFADKDGNRIMQTMFSEVDLPPFSGRAEDSFGIQATLTRQGAIYLASLLKNGATGAKLSYCYDVTGLSPLFDATISLNYHKVYRHFLAKASGGRLWWKWSIRNEVEKLLEDKSVVIKINGGDAKQKDYVMALVDRFINKFFDPILENRRNSAGSRWGVSYTKIVEDRDLNFSITEREIIEREYCVDVGLGQLKDFPHLIVNADNLQE
jgi:hypothetical protein